MGTPSASPIDVRASLVAALTADLVGPFHLGADPAAEELLTLVAMTRLGDPAMTAPASAMEIEAHRTYAEACVDALAERGGRQPRGNDDALEMQGSLQDRGNKVVEAWQKLVTIARHEAAGKRCYSPFDKDKTAGKALLYTVVDDNPPPPHSDEARFAGVRLLLSEPDQASDASG